MERHRRSQSNERRRCGGPFAGGQLSGTVTPYPADWQVADGVEHVQLETYTATADAHSVNIWCVVVDDRLFFATSLVRGEADPAKRAWVQNALADGQARVKIGEALFPGELMKVEDTATISSVKNAFVVKYKHERDERTDNAWVFELAKKST